MSLFKRRQPAAPVAQELTVTVYDGTEEIEVKGEASYQARLEAICGGKSKGGHNLQVNTVLVREPDNPNDENAIQVYATDPKTNQAVMVGWVNRDTAEELAPAIDEKNRAGEVVGLVGRIRGGWDRGGGQEGHFGIWLLFDPTDFGMTPD